MALANNTTRARGKGGGKAGGAIFCRTFEHLPWL